MRTLIGIDANDLYVPAIDLVGRLAFAEPQTLLAHVDPVPGLQFSPAPLVYDYLNQAELESRMRLASEALLDTALEKATEAGLGEKIEKLYGFGNSSVTLMQWADERRADLVAVGSGRHGAFESFFLGSVGRALANGASQSFLIARNVPTGKKKVNAIFATDFSNYADRCFHRLLDMNPAGLERITIVTCKDQNVEALLAGEAKPDEPTLYPISDVEERMRENGDRLAALWRAKGVEAEFRLVDGYPVEALPRAMKEADADLLILGARGHGLIERVIIGSLALHETVAEPYSVLVLRIPEDN